MGSLFLFGFDSAIGPHTNCFSSLSYSTPLQSSIDNQTMAMNKFVLLNANGVARSGFYLEIQQFPQGETPGQAVYVDARGTEDVIKFIYNSETDLLDAWHVKSPNNKFTMTPVLAGQRVVGLDVQFSHLPNFVAHFALDLSTDEEDVVYDVLAPCVYLEELSIATF